MGSWSIRLRVILVIALGVIVALVAIMSFVQRDFQEDASVASDEALQASRVAFDQLRTRDTAMLSAVLDSLMSREDLKQAMASRDRVTLERLAAPVFNDLRTSYGITHLYFLTPDGHVLLRAHQPGSYGDVVGRATYRMASMSGEYGTGLELGRTAYALRVVHSVALPLDPADGVDPHSKGIVVGYVEVGEEIGHFLKLMRKQTGGDQYALLLPKSAILHADWTAVRRQQNHVDDWDALKDWVIVGSTSPTVTAGVTLPSGPMALPATGKRLSLTFGSGSSAEAVAAFPIVNAAGQASGMIVARHDLTPTLETSRRTAGGILLAGGGMTVLLATVVLAMLNSLVFRRLNRLSHLADETTAMTSGIKLDQDFLVPRHDEIGRFEETLRKGLRELNVKSELLDSITDIVYVHGTDGKIIYANQAASLILGYSHEQLLSMNIRDLVPEHIRPLVGDNIAGIVAEKRKIFESFDLKASGEQIPVEVHSQTAEFDERVYVISVVRDLSERKKAERTIERLAYFDPLTGVANRRLFQDRLAVAVAHAKRTGAPFAVAFLDVDKLKPVNDSLGHASGDIVLREIAQRLAQLVRDTDTVSRVGGDEFALLLVDTDERGLPNIGERIVEVMQDPIAVGSERVHASVSAGLAVWVPGDDGDAVLRKSDLAMYQAKQAGADRWLPYDDSMLAEITERYSLQADLRAAVDGHLLELHYQPQLDVRTGRVIGAEALSRWNDTERGQVPADTFIDVAEQSGLIVPLGRWAIDQACRDVAAWRAQGLGEIHVSVNVSASQFTDDDLPTVVARALLDHDVDPGTIALEITESVALTGSPAVVEAMESLAAIGVQLVIDDFGVGYSALDNIADLPIAALKIDRGFVNRIGGGAERDAIVRTIVDLGGHLGLDTIAEGVERADQVVALAGMGCHLIQGFLFAPAMPATDFAEYVRFREAAAKSL